MLYAWEFVYFFIWGFWCFLHEITIWIKVPRRNKAFSFQCYMSMWDDCFLLGRRGRDRWKWRRFTHWRNWGNWIGESWTWSFGKLKPRTHTYWHMFVSLFGGEGGWAGFCCCFLLIFLLPLWLLLLFLLLLLWYVNCLFKMCCKINK